MDEYDEIPNLRERVEALEKFRSGFEENPCDNPSGEAEPIRCGTFSPESAEAFRAIREDRTERKRRDRWHATYDAAITGLLATGIRSPTGALSVETSSLDEVARMVADRAHGSLKEPG